MGDASRSGAMAISYFAHLSSSLLRHPGFIIAVIIGAQAT
jgi:hypothetical protein